MEEGVTIAKGLVLGSDLLTLTIVQAFSRLQWIAAPHLYFSSVEIWGQVLNLGFARSLLTVE